MRWLKRYGNSLGERRVTTAVLRADGSAEVGLGHIMRSLSLGEALTDRGWHVTLAAAELPPEIAARAQKCFIDFHRMRTHAGGSDDAEETVTLSPDLVIVDGYQFDASFYTALSRRHCPHAVIDDNGETEASEPLAIVNQNPHASTEMYEHFGAGTVLLIGLDHVLLRREIRDARPEARRRNSESQVFLAMGGSDPLGLTTPLAESLDHLGISVCAALGAANHARERIMDRLGTLASVRVIAPERFADELARSDVAIVGAGTTMWEAAHLGVPTIGIVVAPNQTAASAAAVAQGFVQQADGRTGFDATAIAADAAALLSDQPALVAMSACGRRAIDGRGAERAAAALDDLLSTC